MNDIMQMEEVHSLAIVMLAVGVILILSAIFLTCVRKTRRPRIEIRAIMLLFGSLLVAATLLPSGSTGSGGVEPGVFVFEVRDANGEPIPFATLTCEASKQKVRHLSSDSNVPHAWFDLNGTQHGWPATLHADEDGCIAFVRPYESTQTTAVERWKTKVYESSGERWIISAAGYESVSLFPVQAKVLASDQPSSVRREANLPELLIHGEALKLRTFASVLYLRESE